MSQAALLLFIERDIAEHPEYIQDLPPALLDRARALVGSIDVDLDAPIEGDVAIDV